MDPIIVGALIGAGSSLLGGVMGNQATSQQNQANLQFQRQFAQHGISWKVADAKRAGIHPLAALGSQTSMPYANIAQKDYSFLGDMGQHVQQALSSDAKIKKETARQLELQNYITEGEIRDKEKRGNVSVTSLNVMGQGYEPYSQSSVMPSGQTLGSTGIGDRMTNGAGVVLEDKRITPALNEYGAEIGVTPFFQYQAKHDMVWLTPSRENIEIIQDVNPHAIEYIFDYANQAQLESKIKKEGQGSPVGRNHIKMIRMMRPAEVGYSYLYLGMNRWKRVKGKVKRFWYGTVKDDPGY